MGIFMIFFFFFCLNLMSFLRFNPLQDSLLSRQAKHEYAMEQVENFTKNLWESSFSHSTVASNEISESDKSFSSSIGEMRYVMQMVANAFDVENAPHKPESPKNSNSNDGQEKQVGSHKGRQLS